MRDRIKESMHIINVLTDIMDRKKGDTPLSECCGVEAYNDDCDICPQCKEHTEFTVDEEE